MLITLFVSLLQNQWAPARSGSGNLDANNLHLRNPRDHDDDAFGFNKSLSLVHRLFLAAALLEQFEIIWLCLLIYSDGFEEWVVKFQQPAYIFQMLDVPEPTEAQRNCWISLVSIGKMTVRETKDNVTNVRVRITPNGASDEYTVHHPSFDPSEAHNLTRLSRH